MDNFSSMNDISKKLGNVIKDSRIKLNMSQKNLARGICSQSMISSIENGQYAANSILLGQICKRLNISMDHILQSSHIDNDIISRFFCRVKSYCESHKYDLLLDYIADSKIIDILDNNEDLQLYYYYFGCALYQTTSELTTAKRYLQLALSYSKTNRIKFEFMTPLDISVKSSLGIVLTDLNMFETASEHFEDVHRAINHSQVSIYEDSINTFFYQYAFSLVKQQKISKAIKLLTEGIDYAGSHQSHYMLSNMFFLLAKCHEMQNNDDLANTAFQSYKLMNSIFHDSVYTRF
ncbi:hypothetical protein A5886_000374 [Enterococcus sp. 8G7_MSG3316]|uniref:HTH cro/C1-type domain-containing protein n=1 Tax=Candidatus Enterococcus testudinis TaxID=1834191 RepID=A0A242A2Q3_9ENTE|nr:helix-turn-helix transcriptional regulator [Enterococcus sp. 8G7_MSG3316]OTN75304.1 hypothetical protein A5886_000374 [Enterococcus sp. 8G7_MSG3316]